MWSEEDIVLIQEMCDVAMDFGPEYNMEKVYEAWEKKNPYDVLLVILRVFVAVRIKAS